jgi:uncharacterized membrane protein
MPQRLEAKPSPIVLQVLWPRDRVATEKSAYRLAGVEDTTVAVYAYNFAALPVTGTLAVAAPGGWEVSIPDRVTLAAGERKQLAMRIRGVASQGKSLGRVQLTGDFGAAGRPILNIRFQTD